jgi:predicted RNase H-like HicB family nuclease
MKNLKKYLVIFEKTRSGYSCYVPDLPGCVATGKTKENAEKNIAEAIQFHLEGMEAEGLKLPVPKTESELMFFTF